MKAIALAFAMTLASTASSASAAEPSAPAAPNVKGLELTLSGGLGAASSTSPVFHGPEAGAPTIDPRQITPVYGRAISPYGTSWSGQFQLGYRPAEVFSFGLSGALRSTSASDSGGARDLSRSAWSTGLYVRGYVPPRLLKGFEPWFSVGVRFTLDTQKYRYSMPVAIAGGGQATIDAEWSLAHYGATIPISIGVDYRFLRYFAVGPSLEYAPTIPVVGCARVEANGRRLTTQCTEESGTRFADADTYHAWSAGLSLRATVF